MKNRPEVKEFSFKASNVDKEKSTFEGFSAGIGNRDDYDDVISPGAFDKTINERVPAKKVKWLDQHDYTSTQRLWGYVGEAKEVPVTAAEAPKAEGASALLWSKFFSSKVTPAQDALTKIDEGILDGLSIGFRPIRVEYAADSQDDNDDPVFAWLMGRGVRYLKEVAWWETSSVIWGANQAAIVIDGTVKELRSIVDKVLTKGLRVDEHEVRETMTSLGRLLKETGRGDTPLPQKSMLDEMNERFAHTLGHIERRQDANSTDRDKLVLVFDEYLRKYNDRTVAGKAFVSLAQAVVDGKEVPEENSAEETPKEEVTVTQETAVAVEETQEGAAEETPSTPAASAAPDEGTEQHALKDRGGEGTASTEEDAQDAPSEGEGRPDQDPKGTPDLDLVMASLEILELEVQV